MSIKKVVAIIRESKLHDVIMKLYAQDVPGVSVMHLKGYGEYVNTYNGLLEDAVKIETMAPAEKVNDIIQLIMKNAHTGLEGDGVIAVVPVEELYRIRDQKQLS